LFFYPLIVSAALLLLAAGYRLSGLGRSRNFALSRAALVGSMLFALALGFVPFLLPEPAVPAAVGQIEIGQAVVEPVVAKTSSFSFRQAVFVVYAVGAGLFLLRLLVNLLRVGAMILRSRPIGNNVRVHRRRMVPFTWGRWILMSESDRLTDGAVLEAHERAHLRGAHWVDMLLANLVQCLTWYALGAWLLKRDLAAVHEYAADAAVLGSGADPERYQMLLIQKAAGRRFANSLTANINHSSLKKRIAMMQENKRASKPRMRVLALVPAALVAVALAVNPAVASEASALTPKPAPVAVAAPAAQQPTPKKVIVENPEVVPVFPGGEIELYKWLARNIRYPEAAVKSNTQGRVVVRFVVNEDGSAGDATVVKGVSSELDAEALRVVGELPKFKPGTVKGKPTACWFTLPINFKLASDTPTEEKKN
ncbi:MAG: M56 family metallopeptidase, partial [Muribaculaceae bacterium]|nr:M56 family metallopeptidase [Muribaculaceae bacterium]